MCNVVQTKGDGKGVNKAPGSAVASAAVLAVASSFALQIMV